MATSSPAFTVPASAARATRPSALSAPTAVPHAHTRAGRARAPVQCGLHVAHPELVGAGRRERSRVRGQPREPQAVRRRASERGRARREQSRRRLRAAAARQSGIPPPISRG